MPLLRLCRGSANHDGGGSLRTVPVFFCASDKPRRGLHVARVSATVSSVKGLLQRVHRAAVRVDGEVIGSCDRGLCVLVGVGQEDAESDAEKLVDRVLGLRVFEDEDGKMNLSLRDVEGGLLLVSQFTLMGDTRRGRRPSFVAAAAPDEANRLFEHAVTHARAAGVHVGTGRFGAHMDIDIEADGPVTLMLDTKEKREKREKRDG